MRKHLHLFLLFTFSILILSPNLFSQEISSWETAANETKLFQKRSGFNFVDGNGSQSDKIIIDKDTRYQSIEGFGWTLTQGSAKLIKALNETQQNELLNELFNTETGIGSAVIRIGIGATDLSERAYTYNESANDWQLNNFSLAGPDLDDLIPILKKAIAINPDIKILATPWTPPTWMKKHTDGWNNFIGGKLNETHYDVYARYFVKYFEAMRAQGLEIWAVTPQNEPLHDGNEPSMLMTKEEQYDFIHNHLGPVIRSSNFSHVKILAYDHNCDRPDYAIDVAKSEYVDGSAFHLYDAGANIGALTQVKNATGKDVYFTEQYTGPGNFAGDFGWHMDKIMLGSMNNWARIALEWNLAATSSYEPRTPGGCVSCLGGLTIDGASIRRNVSYYLIAQMSKVTKAGAYRIKSASSNGDLLNTAFENPDGSTSIIVYNSSNNKKTFDIVWNGKSFKYTLDGNTAASILWTPIEITQPVTGVTLTPQTKTIKMGETFQLSANVLPEDATVKTVKWSTDNSMVATVNDNGVVRGISVGTAIITVTTVNESKTATSVITVESDGSVSLFPEIYNIISRYSNKGLDVKDLSTSSGAGIQQWELSTIGGGDNQRWIFENAGGGYYYIKSKYSNLYLAASTNSMENGVNLVQQTFSGDLTQQWNIIYLPDENAYVLVNLHSGKAMDVSGPSEDNGAKIHLWEYFTTADNQKWIFEEVEKLVTALNPQNKINFITYPNPVENHLSIDFDSEQNRFLQLYSLSGKLMYERNMNQMHNSINISTLNDGIYILKIQDGSEIVYRKIMKSTN